MSVVLRRKFGEDPKLLKIAPPRRRFADVLSGMEQGEGLAGMVGKSGGWMQI
jgi:hypothetical protein